MSAGTHVNSEPVSTSASNGGVVCSSRSGLQATTLTLKPLTSPSNTLVRRTASVSIRLILFRFRDVVDRQGKFVAGFERHAFSLESKTRGKKVFRVAASRQS